MAYAMVMPVITRITIWNRNGNGGNYQVMPRQYRRIERFMK